MGALYLSASAPEWYEHFHPHSRPPGQRAGRSSDDNDNNNDYEDYRQASNEKYHHPTRHSKESAVGPVQE